MLVEEQSVSVASHIEALAKEVPHVTSQPGVYLMKDGQDNILYVGKARNLKKRLSSYFQLNRPHDPKTALLLTKVTSFETIITLTEKEALILESNLIKRHRPRYNVILKDDKRYPSLRLNLSDPYPNLTIVRKIANDGALYFGPYASSSAVRQTLKFINKTFKLCKCRCERLKKRARPCLNYQMGLCMGPCFMEVSPDAYQEVVKEVIAFLQGRTPDLIRKIKKQMLVASDQQQFEQAALLRDKLFALQRTLERQVTVATDFKDRDVIGHYVEGQQSAVTLLRVRGGFLLGSRQFVFEHAFGSNEDQVSVFIRQYYDSAHQPPGQILVSQSLPDKTIIEEFLYDQKQKKVTVLFPQRGDKEKLVQMAVQNAKQALSEFQRRSEAQIDLLQRLQKRLQLRRLPQRIECFDNSSLGGTEPVSGMVVFQSGLPDKSAYRKYILENISKPDDYAYMAEVIKRRYGKSKPQIVYPDLLLLDGGKGQLNIAMAILTEIGLLGRFDVAAIAKKDPNAGEYYDRIYLPGRSNPVQFGKEGDLLLFLQRVRDETHRWVVSFQRKRRKKKGLHSKLDDIDGIGPKRKAQLLKHFGGLEQIRTASLVQLTALPGISEALAKAIRSNLNPEAGSGDPA